jgi:benzoyl-CoA oxygenase/reductase BoxA protein
LSTSASIESRPPAGSDQVLKQHLIDPVICIRCNTCEETCPVDAISHDSRNYVVDPDICNACNACISPCPTGSIDNWRRVLKADAYSLAEQLTWDELPPAQVREEQLADAEVADYSPPPVDASRGSTIAPKSAATPELNRYTVRKPAIATVTGNFRVTSMNCDSDTHHIVLDFGSSPFPVLEGQSIGIIPPGADALGRPHHARQYSIASPRDGERPEYNNLALTVKRVTVDHAGNSVQGVASNYVCNLQKGDQVRVIGPFGATFLMPDDPGAHLLMICTGTGSAPMRAMTERRRRRRAPNDGRLMLFFGARSQQELPYFGPLTKLPSDFIETHLAFSRTVGQPKRYVQDLLRDNQESIAQLLSSPHTHIYVCGLKGMEDGVLDALRATAEEYGLNWPSLWSRLKGEGRLHLETY